MRNLLPRIGFIDETSLKTNMAKTTGWSPRGARLGNQIAGAIGCSEKRTGTDLADERAHDEIRNLLRSGLALAGLIAIAAGVLLAVLGQALPFMGQSDEVIRLTQPILLAIAPGLLPMLWLNVLRQFAIGLRCAGSLFRVTVISIAVNAVLDAAFIYGWFGLPRLGLMGIGLATTLVQTWTFLTYLRTLRRDEKLAPLIALDL